MSSISTDFIAQDSADSKKSSRSPASTIPSRLNHILERSYRIEQAMRRAHCLTVHSASGRDSALISLGLKEIALLQQDIKDCARDLRPGLEDQS